MKSDVVLYPFSSGVMSSAAIQPVYCMVHLMDLKLTVHNQFHLDFFFEFAFHDKQSPEHKCGYSAEEKKKDVIHNFSCGNNSLITTM